MLLVALGNAAASVVASVFASGSLFISFASVIWIVVVLATSLLECVIFVSIVLAFYAHALRFLLRQQESLPAYGILHVALVPVWGAMLMKSLAMGGVVVAVLAAVSALLLHSGLSIHLHMTRRDAMMMTALMTAAGSAILLAIQCTITMPIRGLPGFPFV